MDTLSIPLTATTALRISDWTGEARRVSNGQWFVATRDARGRVTGTTAARTAFHALKVLDGYATLHGGRF